MRSMRFLVVALAVSALLPLAVLLPMPQDPELEAGNLLVADRKLRDPNFARSVILLVKYEDEASIGIMINRRTDVPISRFLRGWKEAKGRQEPVFLGGPVERAAILALLNTRDRGVQFAAERSVLRKQLAEGAPPERFRIYLGYAGWGPEQLEAEIEAGAWHILRGDPKIVFDSDPDSLWSRLIEKTETRIARAAY